MKFIFSILLLTSLTLALQKQEIPKHQKDGNPLHDNQPEWCQNYKDSMVSGNCDCQPHGDKKEECEANKEGDKDEDYWDPRDMPSKCKTACRRSACKCANGCET